jgi:PKHD-type hydroxylase
MMGKYFYWYFDKALSNTICDTIIKLGKNNKFDKGKIGGDGYNKKIRNSNITWLNDKWLYRYIHPYLNIANKNAGWNYQWNYSEDFQLTKYKKNQFYDWHKDSWDKPYQNHKVTNFNGRIRKLSAICSLVEPKDFKGGELLFQPRDQRDPTIVQECKEILPRGSIVVFPSFVYHKVNPVTKGTRYSLVSWHLGEPFK